MTISEADALIIVDVQIDFCPGGALAVPDGNAVVPVINAVSSGFRLVVGTQDWHPTGHVSFASSHAGTAPGETVDLADGSKQVVWPDHCVQGSSGAGFHPDLDMRPIHYIVRKGFRTDLDSYSGFFENDRTTSTGLRSLLDGLGIRRVFVTGLATDYCVNFTAMDAVSCGFETVVIQDACRGIDLPAGSLEEKTRGMKAAGIGFIRSGELTGNA